MAHEKVEDGYVEPQLEEDAYVEEVQAPDDKVPEGGYGWVVVACSFTINGFTWGIWYRIPSSMQSYPTNVVIVPHTGSTSTTT